MSIQVTPGEPSIRAAAQRNAKSHRVFLAGAARSLWRGLCLTTFALATLLALAYWLSWRLDRAWF